MTSLVLAHDVGTGGTKASIVDVNGKILTSTEEVYSRPISQTRVINSC